MDSILSDPVSLVFLFLLTFLLGGAIGFWITWQLMYAEFKKVLKRSNER